ncbi:MAG: NifU family protein [Patescibacteria group bacterium]
MQKVLLEKRLEHLKPILASAGRSIDVLSVETPRATFRLSGFCCGCACSSSYKDGITDLVKEICPEITDINFEEV